MLGWGPVLIATAVVILTIKAGYGGSPDADKTATTNYVSSDETSVAPGSQASTVTYGMETSEATSERKTTDSTAESQTESDSEENLILQRNIMGNTLSYLQQKDKKVSAYINSISHSKDSVDEISGYERLILSFIFSLREKGALLSKFILLLLDDVKPTNSDTFKENLKNLFSFPDTDVMNTFQHLNSGRKCHGLSEHVIDSLFDFLEVVTPIKFNRSILEYGLSKGYVHTIILLVTRGSTARKINRNGDTILHFAARVGNTLSINTLLNNRMAVDWKNKDGLTPLYYAAKERQLEAAKLLVSRGANVDSTDENGESLLHIAARRGDVGAAEILIELGATVDKSNKGMTPLYRAAQFDNKDVMLLLVDKGADMHHKMENGDELIHIAALNNHTTAMDNLLDLGVDIETKGRNGFTPLHTAARSGFNDMVLLILKRGAKVDSTSAIGNTPLHEAAFWSQFEVAETLIRHGANVHSRDTEDDWSDDLATVHEHVAMDYLLAK